MVLCQAKTSDHCFTSMEDENALNSCLVNGITAKVFPGKPKSTELKKQTLYWLHLKTVPHHV